jgi:glycosyltransferase involved in cell wall biosynthesis
MGQSRILSVVVPVWAAEATLRRALESLEHLAAEAPIGWGVEVVVVFDGPDDQCEEIVVSWDPPSIRLVTAVQHRRGVAAARNTALAQVTGDVVTFLDADDEARTARWPAVERVLGTDVVVMGTQEFVVHDGCRIPGADPVTGVLSEGPAHYFMSMCFDRRLLPRVGQFDETYPAGSDTEFVYRLRRLGVTIDLVDAVFTIRHIHGANLTTDETKLVGGLFRALREHRAATRSTMAHRADAPPADGRG